MRRDRIHTPQPLRVGARVELEAGAGRHLRQVLRLGVGDGLVLFNGDGHDYLARLVAVGPAEAVAEVEQQGPPEPSPALAVTLAIGISKGERMDFALQKAVELGATALAPLFTERSVVKLTDERRDKRLRHWQGVVVAACEQSGRRRLPELAPPQHLGAWLDGRSAQAGQGLLLHHLAERTLPALAPPAAGRVTLLVGPEGGLAPPERQAALARGFVSVRLGPRVMRTETAPLAALAALQALWGDFRN
jgi:16S rRNA (uracil1498-N3)-methyltransferase